MCEPYVDFKLQPLSHMHYFACFAKLQACSCKPDNNAPKPTRFLTLCFSSPPRPQQMRRIRSLTYKRGA